MKHRHLHSLVKKKSDFIFMLYLDSHKPVARLDIFIIFLSSNELTLPLVFGLLTRLSTELGWIPFPVLTKSGAAWSINDHERSYDFSDWLIIVKKAIKREDRLKRCNRSTVTTETDEWHGHDIKMHFCTVLLLLFPRWYLSWLVLAHCLNSLPVLPCHPNPAIFRQKNTDLFNFFFSQN